MPGWLLKVTWTTKKRKCHDCSFCILMVAYWAAMVGIAWHAQDKGDWRRLITPQDK
eukprot:COSAG01_NODE_473_length_16542_cov_42.403651_5_plen_56_part_00